MLSEHPGQAAKGAALAAIALAALVLAVILAAAPSASANAVLVRADPPNDSVLGDAPVRVEMWFDQPLVSDFAATQVTLSLPEAGAEVQPLYAAVDRRDPTHLIISPPQALRAGRYLLRWRVAAAQDGSVSEGEYTFLISPSAAPVPAAGGSGGPDILFLSLITLAGIGGATFLGLVLYLARRTLGLGGHPPTEGTLPQHH